HTIDGVGLLTTGATVHKAWLDFELITCFCCHPAQIMSVFFFYAAAPTEIYTLSLHDALPISSSWRGIRCRPMRRCCGASPTARRDRKSTRLNSSHVAMSYAVFCLKKKTTYVSQALELCTRENDNRSIEPLEAYASPPSLSHQIQHYGRPPLQ